MTDDTRPPDDEDRRDERLAAALEVPPLDDVTRRRLVRRALDEAGGEAQGGGRRVRVLAIAAAVLAVLVIGGGTALVLRDDGDDTTVATRNEDARGGAEADAATGPASIPVGDLGDVSDPAVLRYRLASASVAPSAAEAESVLTDAVRCPFADLDPPIQIGTGTYNGAPVLVVAGSRDDERVALVLDAATCQTLGEVPLSPPR